MTLPFCQFHFLTRRLAPVCVLLLTATAGAFQGEAPPLCLSEMAKTAGKRGRWKSDHPDFYRGHPLFRNPTEIEARVRQAYAIAERLEADEAEVQRRRGVTLYNMPPASKTDTETLFLAMNYLKFEAVQARRAWKNGHPQDLIYPPEVNAWAARAGYLEHVLVKSNMRLIVHLAKKFPDETLGRAEKADLGPLALVRAVKNFDVSRGFRFSTYAAKAIYRTWIRAAGVRQERSRGDVGAEYVPDFEDRKEIDSQEAVALVETKELLRENLLRMDERDRQILTLHFGLEDEPMTHEEIARRLGMSRRRVGQVERRALERLATLMGEDEGDE